MNKPDHVCLRCNHKWVARIDNPLCCPNCKRYDWNIIKKEVKKNVSQNTEPSKDDLDRPTESSQSRDFKDNLSRWNYKN